VDTDGAPPRLGEVDRAARSLILRAYDAQGTLLTKMVQHVAPTA
jgi:hypothetical protein